MMKVNVCPKFEIIMIIIYRRANIRDVKLKRDKGKIGESFYV